jgi:hypothetical protein
MLRADTPEPVAQHGHDLRAILGEHVDEVHPGIGHARDERFVLFELEVTSAFSTVFGPDGHPVRQRWRATPGT